MSRTFLSAFAAISHTSQSPASDRRFAFRPPRLAAADVAQPVVHDQREPAAELVTLGGRMSEGRDPRVLREVVG